jgi:hypothetical protein
MSEIKIPNIEMDQIAPGDKPEHYVAAVYIDGEQKDKNHRIELHEDTDTYDIIYMMEYFYRLGFEKGKAGE